VCDQPPIGRDGANRLGVERHIVQIARRKQEQLTPSQ
jgi:hypothetical protein